MEVEVEVGEGSNVGRSFDTRGEERAPEAKANITTTGRLYRAARRYACTRGTLRTSCVKPIGQMYWSNHSPVREPRCLLHRVRISLVKAQLRPDGL